MKALNYSNNLYSKLITESEISPTRILNKAGDILINNRIEEQKLIRVYILSKTIEHEQNYRQAQIK